MVPAGRRVPATGGFIAKLNDALQKRGSAARCWAHCSQGDQGFHWSGENSWIDRTEAASELGNYVRKLRNKGWCCHIVAHSHGGNVVVEALPQITTALRSDAPLGKIVTLGTPFMDTMSPILQRITRDRRGFIRNAWISLIFVMLIMVLLQLQVGSQSFPSKALGFAVAIVVVAAVILFVYFGGRNTAKPIAQMQPKFLAIGSPMDEPWQLLHHMRNASNPMAVQTNLIRYLISSLQSHISRSQQVAQIYGAKSYRDLKPAAKLFAALAHLIVVLTIFLLFGKCGSRSFGICRRGRSNVDPGRSYGRMVVMLGCCWWGSLHSYLERSFFRLSCRLIAGAPTASVPSRASSGKLRHTLCATEAGR